MKTMDGSVTVSTPIKFSLIRSDKLGNEVLKEVLKCQNFSSEMSTSHLIMTLALRIRKLRFLTAKIRFSLKFE
jgi:hypothetical protein